MWDKIQNFTKKLLSITITKYILIALISGLAVILLLSSIYRPIDNDVKVTNFGLKNIGQLCTQEAYVTEVNSTKSPRKMFGIDIPFTQSHYIYSFDFIIKAGFEVNEIIPEVNEETKTVTITLPKAQILSNEVVLDSFKVFLEEESIFNQMHLEDNNSAFMEMQRNAEKTAISNGILDASENNAKTILTSLFANNFDPSVYTYKFVFE